MSRNLHPLLYSSQDTNTYEGALAIGDKEKSLLSGARTIIRDRLKAQLPELIKSYTGTTETITPRFMTQGSYAYKMVNMPCHPGQQIDLDDGVYLPMELMEENPRPSSASDLYFQAIEAVVGPLAMEQGWKMDTGNDNCVRLELTSSMHIDLPLYAIPRKEFIKLSTSMNRQGKASLSYAMMDSYGWDYLPTDQVLLAHRKKDWHPSDPRPIIDWVEKEVATKTEQWRRVVRFLKGWRDHTWPTKGPSSILLLAAAGQAFKVPYKGRDDVALLETLKALPGILAGPIQNPTAPDEILSDRLNDDLKSDLLNKAEVLRILVQDAIEGPGTEEQACLTMQGQFGDRFPMRPRDIKTDTPADVVKSTAASVAVAPSIPTSTRNA